MTQPNTDARRMPVVEIVVIEQLDESTVLQLRDQLDAALTVEPVQVVLDLAACPFVDAAVIGLLVDTHRTVHRGGGALTLRNPPPRLRRNLEIARVDHVLHVIPETVG